MGEIARSLEMTIYAGAINKEHVHLLIGIHTDLSIASGAVLEGEEFHEAVEGVSSLKKRYWGCHLWARGYSVATSGNVTDEVWKKYIESRPEPPDHNIKVV